MRSQARTLSKPAWPLGTTKELIPMADRPQKISAPIEGTFEGKPVISIPLASGKPFTFGVEKAAAIVKHYEAVKAFSAKNPPKALRIDTTTLKAMSQEERAQLLALLQAA